ncbi:MAG: DUF4381 domain-containing protein [Rhodanobacter sp.]|nr:MAG: DUF4381 domain-containing protein [Rhodanobacter sp.]TAL91619.1 MAG: DUF4381 domain-containing protein [Rhodanobacter sp.]TAM41937.1 MAG: DUF4381 domain-containing protein [Rhodanobacter sp.]TAN29226.1 MAG: DUF4381 domain-containing protein [Rhodanobacter sp.]
MIAAAGLPTPAGATAGPSLRDIHLPAAPAWWPPAPGWWLLAALTLTALAALAWAWRRHRRAHDRQQQILGEVDRLAHRHRDEGSPDALLRDLHQLLRRVAREHDARAALQRGAAWRQTLARVPVDRATLDRLLALDQLVYRPATDGDDEALVAAVRQWLRLAVKPSKWKAVTPVQEAVDA